MKYSCVHVRAILVWIIN